MPIIPANQEARTGGLVFKDRPGKVRETLSQEQNTKERTGDIDKVVQCWEAQVSISTTTQKK
jgi:hypothetical protein